MGGFPSPATTYEKPRRSNTNTSITPCSSNCGHTSTSMSGSSLPGRTHSTHCAEKQMGAHPHRTHALGGIAFLSHRSARHQPPYAGDSGTREPLSATLGSRGLSDRTRWWGHFQVLRLGGRVRSHRSRRRPVKWRSGPTCAQVNGLFACKGVGGVGVGRSAGGGVGGVPILPPVGSRCAWRGVAVSGSVCQFRVCSCLLGHCTRSVGNAPLLFGCTAT